MTNYSIPITDERLSSFHRHVKEQGRSFSVRSGIDSKAVRAVGACEFTADLECQYSKHLNGLVGSKKISDIKDIQQLDQSLFINVGEIVLQALYVIKCFVIEKDLVDTIKSDYDRFFVEYTQRYGSQVGGDLCSSGAVEDKSGIAGFRASDEDLTTKVGEISLHQRYSTNDVNSVCSSYVGEDEPSMSDLAVISGTVRVPSHIFEG